MKGMPIKIQGEGAVCITLEKIEFSGMNDQ